VISAHSLRATSTEAGHVTCANATAVSSATTTSATTTTTVCLCTRRKQ
jgi:hypothetical protein